MARLKAYNDAYTKRGEDLLRNCKNSREKQLVLKEYGERCERQCKEKMGKILANEREDLLKRIAEERKTREGGLLSKEVEDRVERLKALEIRKRTEREWIG
ncbi:unnamed protein product [Thlaspi arvense]|uniref:Uncharacterized protein n=1 Tax=Thlaspi arvense TaxID=13288 RepID=A0AAU9T7I8_THLAR|nr:unnamed protein product [Thlaspi arvense]